ncbi:MAG: hypothetical protein ABR974_07770 [Bacteroidales bacterium]|jgi:hypothetical protein
MRRISFKHLIICLVIFFTAFLTVAGQSAGRTRGKNPEKALFGKTRKIKTKNKKVREPKSVTKAKDKQKKNQAKIKKDYFNSVDASKKRAYKIQSPEVQARMKQNQKNITDREKTKKKKVSTSTRRGARKYKK